MKKNKLIKLFIICFSLFICFESFAEGQWVQDGTNTKYKEDGVFLTNTWKFLKIENDVTGKGYNNYYFDENGNMATGLIKIDDNIYSFNSDGTTNTNGKVTIDGYEYETKNKGLVEALPSDFDIDAWKLRKEAEEAANEAQIKQNRLFNEQFNAAVEAEKAITE